MPITETQTAYGRNEAEELFTELATQVLTVSHYHSTHAPIRHDTVVLNDIPTYDIFGPPVRLRERMSGVNGLHHISWPVDQTGWSGYPAQSKIQTLACPGTATTRPGTSNNDHKLLTNIQPGGAAYLYSCSAYNW